MVGDYTNGKFVDKANAIVFVPNAAPAVAHADAFDFSNTAASHVVTDAGIASLHGGHDADIALAHDAAEAVHAHDFAFNHFAHDLFAHGHTIAEALL
jgi:hypothetical protein